MSDTRPRTRARSRFNTPPRVRLPRFVTASVRRTGPRPASGPGSIASANAGHRDTLPAPKRAVARGGVTAARASPPFSRDGSDAPDSGDDPREHQRQSTDRRRAPFAARTPPRRRSRASPRRRARARPARFGRRDRGRIPLPRRRPAPSGRRARSARRRPRRGPRARRERTPRASRSPLHQTLVTPSAASRARTRGMLTRPARRNAPDLHAPVREPARRRVRLKPPSRRSRTRVPEHARIGRHLQPAVQHDPPMRAAGRHPETAVESGVVLQTVPLRRGRRRTSRETGRAAPCFGAVIQRLNPCPTPSSRPASPPTSRERRDAPPISTSGIFRSAVPPAGARPARRRRPRSPPPQLPIPRRARRSGSGRETRRRRAGSPRWRSWAHGGVRPWSRHGSSVT